jgi:hypothetical protein
MPRLQSAQRAAKFIEHGAAAALSVHVARSLYGRWRRLSAQERARLEALAEDVRERALELRGRTDTTEPLRDLGTANRRLADAIIQSAAADPEVSDVEVRELRSELARELERLATGEIRASRGPEVPRAERPDAVPGPEVP